MFLIDAETLRFLIGDCANDFVLFEYVADERDTPCEHEMDVDVYRAARKGEIREDADRFGTVFEIRISDHSGCEHFKRSHSVEPYEVALFRCHVESGITTESTLIAAVQFASEIDKSPVTVHRMGIRLILDHFPEIVELSQDRSRSS